MADDEPFFSIKRTEKVRITINGKTYERWEDVPEEYRALIAKSKQSGPVKRMTSFSFKLDAGGKPLEAPGGPLPPPERWLVQKDGAETLVSWSWMSRRVWFGVAFMAVWDLILAAVARGMMDSRGPVPWYFPAGLLGLLVFGNYPVAAMLFNRTRVRIEPARVSVKHGPLPWRGSRVVLRSQVAEAFADQQVNSEETLVERAVSYRVRARMKDGSVLTLVSGLDEPGQALFLAQLLAGT
jgi:hypothetical protein